MVRYLIKYNIALLLIIAVCVFSCKKEKNNADEINNELPSNNNIEKRTISVKLEPINNSKVTGNVFFQEENNKITLIALVNYLKEGTYKMYILNNKECTDLFENENLHWNPTNQKHGNWRDKSGYHKGDIGEFKADMLGNGTLNFSTDEWCIGCNDNEKDIEGKVLIVCEDLKKTSSNENEDNSIILSCGLIKRS